MNVERMPSGISPRISAVLLCLAIALCFWPAISGATALSLGAIFGLFRLNSWSNLTRPLSAKLLQISVIGLGAGMNLDSVWTVGINSIGYSVLGIGFTFALGWWIGRRAGLPRDLTILLTSGTAICGGSAIAAIAGVLRCRQEETTVALATVFLLNAVALVIFPTLGHALHLDQHQFGLWAALAIHDTSSVVGASASYGDEALKIATTVKLTRALWIAPVALAIGWSVPSSARLDDKAPRTIPLPWFIFAFIAVAALVSYVPLLNALGSTVFEETRRLLVATLFLIGANLSGPALKAVGWRPLVVGMTLWACVSTSAVGAILSGWIR